ncbi:transcriptional regulator NfxB [Paenibacillus donghaensis]|uniref:Transcriptional regulator NfxB n=1 Tax=Paenibacillus donghaensis TaxID=414771 RepID=A0A2Z2KSC4_9BACL|nr:transcriptional regulator NfxB [Paenibacillus donghaensis]ASA23471.1 transcriptional regulator NfxB [Paenibacillus donghaensis]
MGLSYNEDELLKLLAIAIVNSPRSTIKELAEASGISKATLHRFCGTRGNLEVMLNKKANDVIDNILLVLDSEITDYREGLKQIILIHYENKEFLRFMCGATCDDGIENWSFYFKALDNFFLKGQKQGTFKIEISVSTLSEIFVALICGMIDGENRGRIASAGAAELFENFFLYGAVNK